MLWEPRPVRKEANHRQFSGVLPSLPLADNHSIETHKQLPTHTVTPVTGQRHAPGRQYVWTQRPLIHTSDFDAVPTTSSLAHKSKPKVDIYVVLTWLSHPLPPSHAGARIIHRYEVANNAEHDRKGSEEGSEGEEKGSEWQKQGCRQLVKGLKVSKCTALCSIPHHYPTKLKFEPKTKKGDEAICLYVENEVYKVHIRNLWRYNFQWCTGYKVALCRKRRGHQLKILYSKYGKNTPDIDDTPNTLRNAASPGGGSLGEGHAMTS